MSAIAINSTRGFAALVAVVACLLASPLLAQSFGPLKGAVFGTGTDAVIVFLHGDVSRGGPTNYHNPVMQSVARKARNTTAIAMVRPGYSNGQVQSPGNNHDRRDQYTKKNNTLVANTLKSLRKAYPNSRLVVAGHSGGAAQLGAVIGRYPGLVDSAILISCPCDIKTWRAKYRPFPRSERESPIKFAGKIGPKTRVIALTGANDTNTWPGLAEAYVAKAKAGGTPAAFSSIPGADHWNTKLKNTAIQTMLTEAMR